MADLIQLPGGQFVATSSYTDGSLGGWYTEISAPLELRYITSVKADGQKVRRLDQGCLPTSRIPARFCPRHRTAWSDAGPCPVCQPRPKAAPKAETVETPDLQLSESLQT